MGGALVAPILGVASLVVAVWLMGRPWLADIPAGILLFSGLFAPALLLWLIGKLMSTEDRLQTGGINKHAQ